MKKVLFIVMALIIIIGIVGCTGKDENNLAKYVVNEEVNYNIEGYKTIYTQNLKKVIDEELETIVINGGGDIDVEKSSNDKVVIEMSKIIQDKDSTKGKLKIAAEKFEVKANKKNEKLEIDINPHVEKMGLNYGGARLDLKLYLPNGIKLKIDNDFGDITIREVEGIFDINKHSGRVEFKGKMINSPNYFATKFGTIEIWLENGKGYNLKASAGKFGEIKAGDDELFSPLSDGESLNTSIAGGGRKVKLKTTSGEIIVHKN